MNADCAILTGQLVEDFSYSYAGIIEPGDVRTAVDEAWDALAAHSRILTFIPVLVARRARGQLMARAQAEGRVAKKVPELLFACVHNAGRSQMAAALAEHLSARRAHVRSAGSAPDLSGEINPVVIQALQERGITLEAAYPKPLSDSVVRAADVIITMGCGDTFPDFPGKRYEDWNVRDPAGQPIEVVREIRDDIQAHVTTLLRQILN
jgi:arsenate reductase (thioredoxin)